MLQYVPNQNIPVQLKILGVERGQVLLPTVVRIIAGVHLINSVIDFCVFDDRKHMCRLTFTGHYNILSLYA